VNAVIKPSLKTIRPRCKCPGCSLWLRLEAERSDMSYKTGGVITEATPTPRAKTKIVYKDTPQSDARDLLMFNAGRYAAGARDASAIKASEELNRELEQSVE
jgi:hypothetical protein